MKIIRLLVIGVLIFISPMILKGQTIVITGKVMQATSNKPLPGVHVMQQSDWKKGAVTDVKGIFKLEIDPGSSLDSLIITCIGFYEKVIPLKSTQLEQIFFLHEKSNSLEGVEIVGEKLIAEEFSIQKIDRLEIYKNPSAKADVLLAVNALPSSTTIDETANVSFRGSSPAQTGIYFNQVPVYDAVRFSQLNGIGTFSFFNTDIINNVQVFAGNPPLEFGNTTSGLIAIQSEDQLVPSRFTSILLSLANIGINHRQRLGKKSSLAVFGNFQYSSPIKSLNRTSLKDIDSFNSIDGGLHFVSHSKKGLSVKLFNYFLNEGYNYNFGSPSYIGIFKQSRLNNLSILNIFKQFDGGTFSLNIGNRLSHQNFMYSKALYDIQDRDHFYSIQFQRERPYSGMKMGISYDGRFQQFEGNVPVYHFAQGLDHPFETVLPTRNKREILDAFFYYKFIPSDRFTFGLATRKNIPWDNMDHFLSWQFNTDYQLNPLHSIKFAAGNFNQYLLSEGVEDPVRLQSKQLSIDHLFKNRQFEIGTSLFFKQIEFDSNKSQYITGVEFATSYRPNPYLTLTLSYTGLRSNFESEAIKYPSVYDLPYFIRLGMEWNFVKMYTLGIRGLFREGTFYQPIKGTNYWPEVNAFEPVYTSTTESVRYPGYNLLDMSISSVYSIGENIGLVLFASAGNIFNFQNIRQYSYNVDYTIQNEEYFSRRTFYFGGMVTF